jgi:carboxypeptidase family protein
MAAECRSVSAPSSNRGRRAGAGRSDIAPGGRRRVGPVELAVSRALCIRPDDRVVVAHSGRLTARAIGLLALPTALFSQTVTGTVVQAGTKAPVVGALVSLARSTDSQVVARGLSDEQGRFYLRGIVPGSFQLTAKRIGVRPETVVVSNLKAGELRKLEVRVQDVVIPLAAVNVLAPSVCGRRAENAANTARMLDEVRAAVTASMLSGRGSGRTTRYVRQVDATTGEVQSESLSVATGTTERPFYSVPPESLAAHGFAQENAVGTLTYYAPDAEVLASDWFVQAHCFSAIEHPRDSSLIGLSLKPIPGQRHPDIAGVLWLDRQSAELRELDVRYTGLPKEMRDDRVGAHVSFLRLTNGRWVVADWVIRAPAVATYDVESIRLLGRIERPRERADSIVALYEAGGFIDVGTRQASTGLGRITGTVQLPGAIHRGDIAVILSGTRRVALPDSSGHFVFDHILPGRYSLIAIRSGTASDTGMASVNHVLVTPDVSTAVDLRLGTARDVARRACSLAGVRENATALTVYVIDTTSGITVPGLRFAIRATGKEYVSDWTQRLTTASVWGRTTLDGAGAICDRRVVGTLQLEVLERSTIRRIPIGTINPEQADVRLIMLAAPLDVSPRSDSRTAATSDGRAVIAGVAEGVGRVWIDGDTLSAIPDACGRFLLREIPSGPQRVQFEVASGRTFSVDLVMQSSDTLYILLAGTTESGAPRTVLQLAPDGYVKLTESCAAHRNSAARIAHNPPGMPASR